MRILLLNDDYPPRGLSSVGSVAEDLARGYRDRGHHVSVITTHRTEEDGSIPASPVFDSEAQTRGAGRRREGDLWSIPVSYRRALRHWHCLFSPRVSRMLKKIMADIRPDAVHAHNIHTYLTYDALRIARMHTPNVILTAHDVMSFSYSRLATAAYLASEGRETHLTALDHLRQAGLQWNPVRNFCIRCALKKYVTHVVAVSESLAQALRSNGIETSTVIHHGIDCSTWQAAAEEVEAFRERFKLHGKKVILFGGRISLDKGVVHLLRALDMLRREMPNVTLLAVGEEERFQGMLERAGVSHDLSQHIVVTGWLPHEELPAAYASADVVTTPSLCLDTFNLMNLEAMAAAKPVVGTIFGGTPEIVVDGVTGFVRNPLDLPAYTEALRTLLLDRTLAERMGQAGRERAEKHFTLKNQVEEYLRLCAA